MVCSYYSHDVTGVLLLMVLLGTARSIVIKAYFDLGWYDPFFTTILLLLGNSLSLPVYYLSKLLRTDKRDHNDDIIDGDSKETASRHTDLTSNGDVELGKSDPSKSSGRRRKLSINHGISPHSTRRRQSLESVSSLPTIPLSAMTRSIQCAVPKDQKKKQASYEMRHGSVTGLTDRSKLAAQWVHIIPFWVKPIITAALAILDISFRVMSTYYLAASVSELLNNGLDLVAGVLAARFIRQREIHRWRWIGAAVATMGLVVVACSEFVGQKAHDATTESLALGLACIFGTITAGTIKDLTRELFTQESEFPAAQLLGIEGAYGTSLALLVYASVGPSLGFSPTKTWEEVTSSRLGIGMTLGVVLVAFAAALYSILSTTVTSAMTKNMWKNMRGPCVWIIAVVIYYSLQKDSGLGEPFQIPASLMIIAGFGVVLLGVYIYYKDDGDNADEDADEAVHGEYRSGIVRIQKGDFQKEPNKISSPTATTTMMTTTTSSKPTSGHWNMKTKIASTNGRDSLAT